MGKTFKDKPEKYRKNFDFGNKSKKKHHKKLFIDDNEDVPPIEQQPLPPHLTGDDKYNLDDLGI